MSITQFGQEKIYVQSAVLTEHPHECKTKQQNIITLTNGWHSIIQYLREVQTMKPQSLENCIM